MALSVWRNGGASDWRFKDTVGEADKISGRVFMSENEVYLTEGLVEERDGRKTAFGIHPDYFLDVIDATTGTSLSGLPVPSLAY